MLVDRIGGDALDHQRPRAQALPDESGDACAELAVLLAQPSSELIAHTPKAKELKGEARQKANR
jgi:hypothetical protein